MQNCTTIDPASLEAEALIINHIREIIPEHPLPWRATFLDDSWVLQDSQGRLALICLDELGARQYEEFVNNELFRDEMAEVIAGGR